ncbi:hypothetical protein QYM36_003795, partial [Artemia franciscana]
MSQLSIKKKKPQSPPDPKPGIILSMRLQNFMCHDHLAFEFNSHLNFIVGPNGSGKSAVLTGLQVALGAAAKETERGAKLGDLVKKGCTSGSVSVTLSNYGPFGYKKDIYGSAITIVRTLKTSGSSSFKILNSAGTVQDHTRDAIEQITAALNIPINNPMCILTQNTAKTFLSTCSPAGLYDYFATASLLSDTKEHLERTYKDLKEMKSAVKAKSEILEKIDEEVEEKRKKLELAQDLASGGEKLKKLKDEYQWALVKEAEVALKDIETEINKKKSQIITEEEAIKGIEKKISTLTQEDAEITARAENGAKESDELRDKIVRLQPELSEAKEQQRAAKSEYSKAKGNLQRKDAEIKSLTDEIQRIRETDFGSIMKKKEEDERKIVELETTQKAYEQAKSVAENDFNQFDHAKKRAEDESSQCLRLIQDIEKKIRKRTDDIQRCIAENDAINLFGRDHASLVKDIRARGLQNKIKGPIGAYLNVKNQSWAPAISCALGGEANLTSYLVDSDKTAQALRKMMGKHGFRRLPTITACRFLGKVHDVQNEKIRIQEGTPFKSLMEELICDDPDMMNLLIDTFNIYSVALIESEQDAMDYMSERHLVPRNCSVGYTKKGQVFYPDPNYRVYPSRVSTQTFLQEKTEDIVQSVKREIEHLDMLKVDNLSKRRAALLDAKANEEKLAEAKARIENLTRNIRNCRMQIGNLEREVANVAPNNIDIMTYQEDLNIAEAERVELKSTEESQLRVFQKEEDNLNALKKLVEQAQEELREKLNQVRPLMEEQDKVFIIYFLLYLLLGLYSCIRASMADYKEKKEVRLKVIRTLQNGEKELVKKQKKTLSDKDNLEKEAIDSTSGRISPSDASRTLAVKISALKATLDDERRRHDLNNLPELIQEKMDLTNHANDIKSKLDELGEDYKRCKQEFEQRWRHLTRLQNHLATKVYYNLKGILAIREFNVETDIDFKSESFLLKISPKGGDCQDVA